MLYVGEVPVAVVEAKDDSHHEAAGLQQAMSYAELLDVSFAYSSNGKAFVEFDYLTNVKKTLQMSELPTPQSLASRLSGLLPSATSSMAFPYNTTSGMHPRYYQDVAVRRTLAAIENGKTRLLLALATGTGKTYIASQIAWKLYGTKRMNGVVPN